MFTYLIIDSVFFAIAALVVLARTSLLSKKVFVTLVIMILLTLIFDNLMIVFGLFRYDTNHITGIYLGIAPLEDFAYPIVAAIIVPFIWERTKRD